MPSFFSSAPTWKPGVPRLDNETGNALVLELAIGLRPYQGYLGDAAVRDEDL